MKRIDKENYYLDIAETVLERSTCLRRCYGAIIVKNDEIVSTGYNGAPRGRRNCMDLGYCTREAMQVPSGERYELCRSVHAEMNAIISAARRDTLGATLYLAGREAKSGELLHDATSCSMCRRVIINADQRGHRPGGHPQRRAGLPGGPCGGLGAGGRLPARKSIKQRGLRLRSEPPLFYTHLTPSRAATSGACSRARTAPRSSWWSWERVSPRISQVDRSTPRREVWKKSAPVRFTRRKARFRCRTWENTPWVRRQS